jgi:quinol monooxygenase YgiN
MQKPIWMSAAAIALAISAAALLSMPAQHASAQAVGAYVNAVNLDIAPGEMEKFLVAIKENGAASVKEPGCRRFDIVIDAKNPNHVFLFEVYDNEAALTAHRNTEHFKKYMAETGKMVTGRNVRAMTAVAFKFEVTPVPRNCRITFVLAIATSMNAFDSSLLADQ